MTLTASSLPRVFACKASAVLPRQDYTDADTAAGHNRHAEQSDAIGAGDTSVIPEAVLALVEGLDLETELAMGYDVSTGEARIIGRDIGRAYGTPGPFEICGSCDLIGHGQGRAVIVDWKSYQQVDNPGSNAQLLCYALMAARIFDVSEVTVVVAHIVESNRRVYTAKLDAFDLDGFAASLRQLHIDVAKAMQDPHAHEVTGKHCRYCTAFSACGKQSDLVQLVRREDVAMQRLETTLPILTDDTAADYYELWKRVGILQKRLGQAIYAKAADRPIPIGGGKFFGKVMKQGNEKLDGDCVWSAVEAHYGREVADSAVIRTATKTRLKEALGKVIGKGGLAAAERSVLDVVRAAGGSKREEKEEITEFVPQLKAVNE